MTLLSAPIRVCEAFTQDPETRTFIPTRWTQIPGVHDIDVAMDMMRDQPNFIYRYVNSYLSYESWLVVDGEPEKLVTINSVDWFGWWDMGTDPDAMIVRMATLESTPWDLVILAGCACMRVALRKLDTDTEPLMRMVRAVENHVRTGAPSANFPALREMRKRAIEEINPDPANINYPGIRGVFCLVEAALTHRVDALENTVGCTRAISGYVATSNAIRSVIPTDATSRFCR